MRIRNLSLSFAMLACAGTAQVADVTLIGTGCATPEGTPAIHNNGLPRVGQSFEIFYTGPNHQQDNTQAYTQPFFVLGFTLIGPATIPTTLLPLQPPGCDLYPSHDIVIPMNPDLNGRNTYENLVRLSLGNDPSLLGVAFFAQWLPVHVQCGIVGCGPAPDWVAASDAAICTIGT